MTTILRRALLALTTISLTGCPENNSDNPFANTQWSLYLENGVAPEYVQYMKFSVDEVEFFDSNGECWDYKFRTYEVDGDRVLLDGGEDYVEFEEHGDEMHIFPPEGGEKIFMKDDFEESELSICSPAKSPVK